jgi:small-conductance mechanosensitive channel
MTRWTEWLPDWVTAGLQFSPRTLITIALLLLAAWILSAVSRRAIRLFRLFAGRSARTDEDHRRIDTLARAFRYLSNVALIGITGMLVLSELGVSIAPILGAAGIVGIAVGFGAQSLVKDFFIGFVILLENQIRQGDVITIAGRTGVVESVTLRNVRLRDYDGSVHFVPNGLIDVVTNQSMEFSYAVIDVAVAYREQADAVFDALREVSRALRADPAFTGKILEDIEIAGVERLTDSSMVLRGRLKCAPLAQAAVRRESLRRIKECLEARGIQPPPPQAPQHGPAQTGRPAG